MKVSLLTDAPRHNLALMKISTYHKKRGDEVKLNMPLWKADITYGSWIFENSAREYADDNGGIGYDPKVCLPEQIEKCRPDYSLFKLHHSLGYTFRGCRRGCQFCRVPKIKPDFTHHSLDEFINLNYSDVELLNNNTFYDPDWEYTFMELDYYGLHIIDNGGNDLRLLNDYRVRWIKRLKWKNQPKFAWDRMKDEKKIIVGMKLLQKYKINAMVYVLMGFDTTPEEDLYRCEIINSMGFDPFPMLYKQTIALRRFRRFIYARYYKSYPTIKKAWDSYKRKVV